MATAAEQSHYSCVPGYHLDTLFGDWMHDVYLGFARDSTACTVVEIASEGSFMRGLGVDDTFTAITYYFKHVWCKRRDMTAPPIGLTRTTCGWSKNWDWPEMSSKFKAAHIKAPSTL
eukprot:8466981-Pyramimonas_sp.AAC.1